LDAEQAEAERIADEMEKVRKSKLPLSEAKTLSEVFDIAKARENVKQPLPYAINYALGKKIKFNRRDIKNIIMVEGYSPNYFYQLQRMMKGKF